MMLPLNQKFRGTNRDYAVNLVHSICCLAGDPEFFDHRRSGGKNSLAACVERHDTARLFDWLVAALSYQGIADRIAHDYMQRHGRARWASIDASLALNPSCPKLNSYWQFEGCRYRKGAATCSEPQQLPACPLPALPLRNGNLNQMAYSLFLFIRDAADGDLVAWIDAQLEAADSPGTDDRLEAMRAALLEPLRGIYGVYDKVLSMALAELLLGAGQHRPRWLQVGTQMIAVDRLVHNFLHRTGILCRLEAEHAYGPACYRAEGCTGVIGLIATEIDAREFNGRFPKIFPRFVQHAIWRYCAASGLDICNGNNIDDRKPCANSICRLYSSCDRLTLREKAVNTSVNT
jgi:hypothetical protein